MLGLDERSNTHLLNLAYACQLAEGGDSEKFPCARELQEHRAVDGLFECGVQGVKILLA
mgnify:CR=1 FL=1